MPNMEEETTKYAVAIPKLGSLILAHSLNGEIKGLKEWPRGDRPNAPMVFLEFPDHGRHRFTNGRCGYGQPDLRVARTAVCRQLVS